jgi:tetratricopeptide (TPR) repeat protein
MPLIMKTKLAVFAIGLLAMQITDSARGSGTRGGATGLLINGDASALVSSDMAVVPSYIPLDPLRPYAARAGQNGTGGAQPMNNGLPGPDPNIFRYADFEKLRATGHAGAYLSGNVSVAGGNLPWAPIQITVMCKGKTSFTTTADPKGGFVIAEQQRFDSTQIIGKEQSFIGQFIGCTVTAALPGFESSQLTIAPRDVREGPMIGSIKLTPEEGSTGSAVSVTTAAAPKEAVKSFHKAREDWLSEKPDRAQRELQKALEIYPQFAEAWYQLGRLQAILSSPEAFNSLSKAAAADPKFVLPYELMAALSATAGKWQKVVDETNHALALNSRGNLDVWYYHALGNYQLKRLDIAQASAAKSLSMDPLHVQPATEQLLAVILSAQHDQQGALEHLRNCRTYFPPGPNLELVKRQIAQIESDLAAKTASAKVDSTVAPEPDLSAAPTDEDVPTTNGSCPLEEVLPRVTRHVEEFVENVDRFTAQEVLVHKLFDRDGALKGDAESRSNYIATIQKVQSGLYSVTEYRGDTQGTRMQGAIEANVAAALVLVFHPAYIQEYAITCAGPADWLGYNTWRVDFRQRLDRPATLSALELGNNEYTLLLKGSAWIDRSNYQIVHMETDLLRPIPDIRLKMLHQSVDYGPVTFASGAATLWLPQTADVTADFREKRLAERHTYSKFQIFSVNTEEKLKLPPESPN